MLRRGKFFADIWLAHVCYLSFHEIHPQKRQRRSFRCKLEPSELPDHWPQTCQIKILFFTKKIEAPERQILGSCDSELYLFYNSFPDSIL